MKGLIIDAFVPIFGVLVLITIFGFLPLSLDIKIKQVYQNRLETLAAQDALLSIAFATNPDTLNNNQIKGNYEIIGEKYFMQQQNINFLQDDLGKILKVRCFTLEFGNIKLSGGTCPKDKETESEFSRPLVLPYNPTKLATTIRLVTK